MENVQSLLLIDDDGVSNFLMQELIREKGLAKEVVSKKTVSDGLQYLTSCSHLPELILLDLYIGDETGFDFLRLYTELGLHKNATAVVLLSGHLSDEDRQHAASYDAVTALCIKPLEMDQLAEIIEKL